MMKEDELNKKRRKKQCNAKGNMKVRGPRVGR
jgi:hypothetical protein